ncbi:hypothetical protein J1N35_034630 [Gossypium stocksii]|uniref:Uncharacterized protein n=1 Tax=Gossypium stocksii TaxID=47602 RepID=A0A9D3USE0_9ROSI|nr:hypothetical protein J1N35_034630 [Gossypium stocksii]
MVRIAIDYFKDLFRSTSMRDGKHLLSGIQPCIFENLNEELTIEFKAKEIMEAVKSVAPLKALDDSILFGEANAEESNTMKVVVSK